MSDQPPITFRDRVAIVTGSGNGLGREYARELARRGARVVVNDVVADAAEQVAAELRSAGGTAVADSNSVDETNAPKILETALREFGRLDALVNNAGIVRSAPFEDVTWDELEAMLRVHLFGHFVLSQQAFRHMKERRYGRIVNVTSNTAFFGGAGYNSYVLAKGALASMTNNLALEGEEHGVLANGILPMATVERNIRLREAAVARGEADPSTLIRNPRAEPTFVAPMVAYLASEACTTTHRFYSATQGRFARVYMAVTRGWVSLPDDVPPTAEDIAAHLPEIEDESTYYTPMSVYDEAAIAADDVAAAQNRG